MKRAIIAGSLLLSAACTDATTNLVVNSDLCQLSRREMIDFIGELVDVLVTEHAMPSGVSPEELTLKLVAAAAEKCGAEPPDGGV